MEYLVQVTIADSGRSTTSAEGLVFLEQYVLPTFDACRKLRGEHRIVAGGPVSGAVALAFIIRADIARAIEVLVGNLPIWPCMVTTVTPLTTWSDRASALRPRPERLRTGRMPGEFAQLSGVGR